jgi:hypothetical protein
MTDIKAKYGTQNQTITITLNELADDDVREGTAIDNSTNCFLDALVQLIIATSATAPAGDKNLLVYAYGSVDGGTTYSGAATGSDAAFGGNAGQLIDNCVLIGAISVDAASESFEAGPFSIAAAFGGKLPDHWGIIVKNQYGGALAASGNAAKYQGVYAQSG